ncbi:MAG: penicillin-binding protein 2 [Polyangiaceae bacterium]|nr:penicillin-binding protein 2 [Polyangiaceae bacterium]
MTYLGQRSDTAEFRRRFRWHALFVVLVFGVLVGRMFQLQVVQGADYQEAARENIIRRVTLATTRGVVRDSQGRVLASSRPSYNVYLVPLVRVDRKYRCLAETESWTKLIDYMRLTAEERQRLEKKINDMCVDLFRRFEEQKKERNKKPVHVPQVLVREDVSRDIVATLETHESELKGVEVVSVPVRYYPYGDLSAHMLGYMSEIDGEMLSRLRAFKYIEGDRIGAAGVERGWESYLRGLRGWEKVIVDAHNTRHSGPEAERLLDEPRRLDPVPGRDLRLTVDIELVEAIDKAMRGQIAGSAVVTDVRTGRILALYSKPGFDPNVLSGGMGKQAIRDAIRRLYSDPLLPTLDKTMSGSYPPGSTFKPFSALAGLRAMDDQGRRLIDPQRTTQCRGFITYGKRPFRCTHVHGPVNLRDSITRSCNVYFYQLGDQVGLDALAKVAFDYGFGAKTGLGVNPESSGRIPTMQWYATHFKGQFRGGFTLNAAIGQGATTTSVLQLALAYAALANGGTLYQPQLVRAIETSDGAVVQEFPPRVKRRIDIDPEHHRLLMSGLYGVVNEDEGTAYNERPQGVDVAGKTGTAQTSHRGVHGEDQSKVWYFNRDHAWFAGFSPFHAPEIAFAVLIEHGGVGGKAAAPVAFAAAKEYQRLVASRMVPKNNQNKAPPGPRRKKGAP